MSQTTKLPGLRMRSFDVEFPECSRGIRYRIPEEREEDGLDIWRAAPPVKKPALTTLEVTSGGGKTTLAYCIASFLAAPAQSARFHWAGTPDTEYAVAMLPQRSSTVLHWRVRNLFPVSSALFEEFIPGATLEEWGPRHLSELSGGQISRVLLASTLENVLSSGVKNFYLILDEPFDGLDAALAHDVLTRAIGAAESLENAPVLRILLISHFDPAVVLKGITCRRLQLTPAVNPLKPEGGVTTYREVHVDEAV